jgi:GTPase SAR1 family protein
MGALVVYDITDTTSYQSIADRWLPTLRQYDFNKSMVTMIIGNKLDLAADFREV